MLMPPVWGGGAIVLEMLALWLWVALGADEVEPWLPWWAGVGEGDGEELWALLGLLLLLLLLLVLLGAPVLEAPPDVLADCELLALEGELVLLLGACVLEPEEDEGALGLEAGADEEPEKEEVGAWCAWEDAAATVLAEGPAGGAG